MIGHGLGPGGRFCLWGRQKLKSFERRATEASHARAKTTQDAAGDSIMVVVVVKV